MFIKRIVFILFFIVLSFQSSFSQIIDDTTKLAYGPKTIHYVYEESIKYNALKKNYIDTFPTNSHHFEIVERLENKYQNLGNLGTALRSIFYVSPEIIGAHSGFNAYNPYFKRSSELKYYDTKSPFTDMFVLVGGNGRASADLGFSRNVSPTWNLGIDFKRIAADKQFGATTSEGDLNVESTSYDIYTGYNSKDSTYQLMFNYIRLAHNVFESGGIEERENFADIFDNDNPPGINLNTTRSLDKRTNIHLYHQYKLGNGLQVYHAADKYNQSNLFQDTQLDFSYYNDARYQIDSLNLDSASTKDQLTFRVFKNELGIKGDIANGFYSFNLKSRIGNMQYGQDEFIEDKKVRELYLGTYLRYNLGENTNLGFKGELNFENGYYLVDAKFENPFIKASYKRSRYAPSLISERYFGNHYNWSNSFSPISSDVLQGELKYEKERFLVNPKMSITNVSDLVYYGLDRKPAQANGSLQILSPQLDVAVGFLRKFHFKSEFIYSLVEGSTRDVLRMPKFFMNGQFYYENRLFKNDLWIQFGVDVHYKSTYFANDYDVVTQQFFLQNDAAIKGYVLTDAFANLKIQRWKFLLKMTNLGQGWVDPGYFATPNYVGQQRAFDVAIHWVFFD